MLRTIGVEKPTSEIEYDLPWMRTNLALEISGEAPIRLLVDGEVVMTIPAGRYRDVLRLEGDIMSLKSAKPFTYHAVLGSISPFEPTDEREIPQPRAPSNILQQMHREFRRSLGVMRESFESDGPWPGYELDDDEPMLFEEEEAEQAREAAKASKRPADAPPVAAEPAVNPPKAEGTEKGAENTSSKPT